MRHTADSNGIYGEQKNSKRRVLIAATVITTILALTFVLAALTSGNKSFDSSANTVDKKEPLNDGSESTLDPSVAVGTGDPVGPEGFTTQTSLAFDLLVMGGTEGTEDESSGVLQFSAARELPDSWNLTTSIISYPEAPDARISVEGADDDDRFSVSIAELSQDWRFLSVTVRSQGFLNHTVFLQRDETNQRGFRFKDPHELKSSPRAEELAAYGYLLGKLRRSLSEGTTVTREPLVEAIVLDGEVVVQPFSLARIVARTPDGRDIPSTLNVTWRSPRVIAPRLLSYREKYSAKGFATLLPTGAPLNVSVSGMLPDQSRQSYAATVNVTLPMCGKYVLATEVGGAQVAYVRGVSSETGEVIALHQDPLHAMRSAVARGGNDPLVLPAVTPQGKSRVWLFAEGGYEPKEVELDPGSTMGNPQRVEFEPHATPFTLEVSGTLAKAHTIKAVVTHGESLGKPGPPTSAFLVEFVLEAGSEVRRLSFLGPKSCGLRLDAGSLQIEKDRFAYNKRATLHHVAVSEGATVRLLLPHNHESLPVSENLSVRVITLMPEDPLEAFALRYPSRTVTGMVVSANNTRLIEAADVPLAANQLFIVRLDDTFLFGEKRNDGAEVRLSGPFSVAASNVPLSLPPSSDLGGRPLVLFPSRVNLETVAQATQEVVSRRKRIQRLIDLKSQVGDSPSLQAQLDRERSEFIRSLSFKFGAVGICPSVEPSSATIAQGYKGELFALDTAKGTAYEGTISGDQESLRLSLATQSCRISGKIDIAIEGYKLLSLSLLVQHSEKNRAPDKFTFDGFKVAADSNGEFVAENFPRGTYCFRGLAFLEPLKAGGEVKKRVAIAFSTHKLASANGATLNLGTFKIER